MRNECFRVSLQFIGRGLNVYRPVGFVRANSPEQLTRMMLGKVETEGQAFVSGFVLDNSRPVYVSFTPAAEIPSRGTELLGRNQILDAADDFLARLIASAPCHWN